MERRLAAALAGDVVGYSRLMRKKDYRAAVLGNWLCRSALGKRGGFLTLAVAFSVRRAIVTNHAADGVRRPPPTGVGGGA